MHKLFILFCIVLISCAESSEEKNITTKDSIPMVDFRGIDSVEAIYYPDPAEQKIYKMTRGADSGMIRLLTADLEKPSISAAECKHYKKLYLFRKGGVFKTVYISDSCKYLAFAVDGVQHYRPLSDSLRSRMDLLFQPLLTE